MKGSTRAMKKKLTTKQIAWSVLKRYPDQWLRPMEVMRAAQKLRMIPPPTSDDSYLVMRFGVALKNLYLQEHAESIRRPRSITYRFIKGTKMPQYCPGEVPETVMCEKCGVRTATEMFRKKQICSECLNPDRPIDREELGSSGTSNLGLMQEG